MDIDKIISFKPNSSFSIEREKVTFVKMGGNLSKNLSDLKELDRGKVLDIISSPKFGPIDEFIAILFWGIYFQVSYKKPAQSLINWLSHPSASEEIEKRKQAIIHSENPADLFKDFDYKGKFKIPGISYAYFTKLFYFYRKSEDKYVYPIMDKWLSIAWVVIDNELTEGHDVYEKYFKNNENKLGYLRRKKRYAYSDYTQFIHSLSSKYNESPSQIELSLFGEDLKSNKNEENPRIMYKEWALNNGYQI